MRWPNTLVVLLLLDQALAQTSQDLLSSLISEGYSIFTAFTSVAGASTALTSNPLITSQQPSVTFPSVEPTSSLAISPVVTETPSSFSLSSSLTSPSPTSSSLSVTSTAVQTSSAQNSLTTSNTSQSGTATPASATSSNVSSNHDRNLAIVLGTVFGALALGLFILLLVLLFHRRRYRGPGTGTASFISASDEALAANRRPSAHARPSAAAFPSRRSRASTGQTTSGVPLMSERTNYDTPAANHLPNTESTPFILSDRDAGRSAGALPMHGEGSVGRLSRFQEESGLDKPTYRDGGAVDPVFVAGTSNTASSRFGDSRRQLEPGSSDDSQIHPAYRDEPFTLSSDRPSIEGIGKRSGSVTRGTFYGSQDQAENALQSGPLPTSTDTGWSTAGVITGEDRGRKLTSNLSSHPGPSIDTATSVHHAVSLPSSPEQLKMRSLDQDAVEPATEPVILDFGAVDQHSRSRSRSQSYPPPPPALTIPRSPAPHNKHNSNTLQDNGNTTYRESMLQPGERLSGQSVSPQTGPEHSAWDKMGDLTATDDFVSPVSPDNGRRSIGRGIPLVTGKASLVDVPRSRSTSPGPSTRQKDLFLPFLQSSPPSTSSYLSPGNPTAYDPSKNRSGLVHAVQDHFQRTASLKSAARPQRQDPVYQAYLPPDMGRPPVSLDSDDTTGSNRSPPKPIARKPVPRSSYNSARSTYQAIPSDESEWRGQEELAWIQNYISRNDHDFE